LRPQIIPPSTLNFQLQLDPSGAPQEATLLNLSIEKAERLLGWKPKWGFEETIKRTVTWYDQVHRNAVTPLEITRQQITEYQGILP
jgi:CDP-glucose 4,6-dehydratase